MPHRLYTGSFAALEPRLLECIAELQSRDRVAAVPIVVGSNLLASYLKVRIAERAGAAANVRFYTFLDLATCLADSAAAPRKRRLPPLGAAAILDALLEQDLPRPYQQIARLAGFRAALLDTFRDLRDAGVTPAELERGARTASPDRREQLDALAGLFRRFRGAVDEFADVDDLFRRAIEGARSAPRLLESDTMFVYGVYDVTGQQDDLLRSLAGFVTLSTFVPTTGPAAGAFAEPFVEKRSRELAVEAQRLEPAGVRRGARRLAERLFAAGSAGDPAPDDGSFRFVSAPGDSRAAIEAAREILRAVRDGIIAGFHEAAVLLRHHDEEAGAFAECLRLRGIPCFIDGGTPFAKRPIARAALALAGLDQERFSRRAVLRVLELIAAALAEGTEGTAASWSVSEWRALTNSAAFLHGADAWEEGTAAVEARAGKLAALLASGARAPLDREEESHLPSVEEAERRLEAARALRRAWKAVAAAAGDWPDALSWRGWSRLLEERFEPLLGAASDWGAFSSAIDHLAALEETSADETVTRARMTATFADALARLSQPDGRFLQSGVAIVSIEGARGLRLPLVVVAGLDEGRFPARVRQDPLLFDAERSMVAAGRLPVKTRRLEEEKLLFDMAVRSAERRLILMTSRLDESSDRERIPSSFFLAAASAARGRLATYRDLAEGAVPGFRSAPLDATAPDDAEVAVDEGEVRLRLIAADPEPALQILQNEEGDLVALPRAFDRARWERRLTAYDGRIRDPELRRWLADRVGPAARQVSASRLEEYAKCPYFFFLRNVAEVEPWEEAEVPSAFDPLERGIVVHEILEAFVRDNVWAGFGSGAADELRVKLRDAARAGLERARPAGIPELLWRLERDRLTEVLEGWLDHEIQRADAFVPASVEARFGDWRSQPAGPAVRVAAGGRRFEIRGRIDRVDLSIDGTRARVVDYKIGRRPASQKDGRATPLAGGEAIQIAVYRAALAGLAGFENVRTIEGQYLYLDPRRGEVSPCSFGDADLAEAAGRLPKLVQLIDDGIGAGRFLARTRGRLHERQCVHCDYVRVCGKDRERREDRKASDRDAARFAAIAALDGPDDGGEDA